MGGKRREKKFRIGKGQKIENKKNLEKLKNIKNGLKNQRKSAKNNGKKEQDGEKSSKKGWNKEKKTKKGTTNKINFKKI